MRQSARRGYDALLKRLVFETSEEREQVDVFATWSEDNTRSFVAKTFDYDGDFANYNPDAMFSIQESPQFKYLSKLFRDWIA